MLHINASPAASCGASAPVTLLEDNFRFLIYFSLGIQSKSLTTSARHNRHIPRIRFQWISVSCLGRLSASYIGSITPSCRLALFLPSKPSSPLLQQCVVKPGPGQWIDDQQSNLRRKRIWHWLTTAETKAQVHLSTPCNGATAQLTRFNQ